MILTNVLPFLRFHLGEKIMKEHGKVIELEDLKKSVQLSIILNKFFTESPDLKNINDFHMSLALIIYSYGIMKTNSGDHAMKNFETIVDYLKKLFIAEENTPL